MGWDEALDDLDAPRLFALAWRVGAYGGVMTMRAKQEPQPSAQASAPADGELTLGEAAATMPDVFSVAKVSA